MQQSLSGLIFCFDMTPQISFRKQFSECTDAGFCNNTVFESFEEHPENLPAFLFLPKFDKMRKAIETGELKGFDKILCGRFGGDCHSGNPECRKLRGFSD